MDSRFRKNTFAVEFGKNKKDQKLKQMNNLIESLKLYFQNTPREEILEKWSAVEKFDQVGVTVEEFLRNTAICQKITTGSPPSEANHFQNIDNPKFVSGFFFSKIAS